MARFGLGIQRSDLTPNLAAGVLDGVRVDIRIAGTHLGQQIFQGHSREGTNKICSCDGALAEHAVKAAWDQLRWGRIRVQPHDDRAIDTCRGQVDVGHPDVDDVVHNQPVSQLGSTVAEIKDCLLYTSPSPRD